MMMKHKTVNFLAIAILLSGSGALNAQVTIGSDIEPASGSLLELKQTTPSADNATSSKGMLFPRVSLTSQSNLFPMFETDGIGGYKIGTTPYVKADEDKNHIGLTVYNVNKSGFIEGLHMWNGTTWRLMDDGPSLSPRIERLLCSSATLTPNSYQGGVLYEGVLRVPYIGGNGVTYPGTASAPQTLSNGLHIERIGGKLNVGAGEILYRVSGHATHSSPTAAVFELPIDFQDDPLDICAVTVGNQAEIKTIEYVKHSALLDANIRTNSEVQFKNMKVRLYGLPTADYPQFTPTIDTHIIYQYTKHGKGGVNFSRYGQIAAKADRWYAFDNAVANTSAGSVDARLNAANRDIASALVVLQHNDVQEIYRLTFNAYTSVGAMAPTTTLDEGTNPGGTPTVPAATGTYTVFIELLQ
ncbi:MAG: hypothetical protein LBD45_07820 [Bacteroidales bacterium]|jgi:hypothetical protein|nr:hypothetical protein [Bacteroidales bacterium]